MSKQVRTPDKPKPAQRSGPSYAELKAENERLHQSLVNAVDLATQYQAIAEKYQTALNAANVLASNISYILLQTLAGALPSALLRALEPQSGAAAAAVPPTGGEHKAGGLTEAPVFSGVAKESGSSVPLSGEASDDGEWVDDDDDDIDSDKV